MKTETEMCKIAAKMTDDSLVSELLDNSICDDRYCVTLNAERIWQHILTSEILKRMKADTRL